MFKYRAKPVRADDRSILAFASVRTDGDATEYALLLRAGAVMLAVLLAAMVFYRIPGAIGGHGEEVGGWMIVIGSFTAYYFGYKAVESSSNAAMLRRPIIVLATVFCLMAALVPEFFSTDVYCYSNIGWQQAKYGRNPYVYSLSEVPNWTSDPMFYSTCWNDSPCAYGFLYAELTCAVAWLANGNRETAVLLFKLLNVAVFMGTGWLIWRGCKYLRNPDPERTLYLFLWNPLLLFHILSDGHNDLLMGLCTAAGILCAVAGGWLGAVPLVLGGALVKYGSVILMPFLLLYLFKRYGAAKAAIGLSIGAILCAVAAAPYLQDWRQIALGRVAETLSEWRDYTLAAMLYFPYGLAAGMFPSLDAFRPQVMTAIKLTLGIGFLALYARQLLIRLRGPYDAAKLLYDCVLVQFVLVCFVSCKFYPWYLGMFLPLAYLLPRGDRLRHAVLAVACVQVLQFTFIRSALGINTVILLLAPTAFVWLEHRSKAEAVQRDADDSRQQLRRAA
jgi:alpha-1,6-mannosyltransferase